MMTKNIYQPYGRNINRMANWWRNPKQISCAKDKGGSFNMQLYLDYLAVVSEASVEQVKRVR